MWPDLQATSGIGGNFLIGWSLATFSPLGTGNHSYVSEGILFRHLEKSELEKGLFIGLSQGQGLVIGAPQGCA